jgi:ankyrin repeat protein
MLSIIQASKFGNLKEVKRLLKNGADVHDDNDNALRWASCNGHLEVVKLLLANGADVHANNDESLKLASRSGYLKIVKLLVEHGADINKGYSSSFNRHPEIVAYYENRFILNKLNQLN